MIEALLGDFLGYIIGAGVLIAGALGLWFKAKSEGRQQEKAKQTEKIHEKVTKADKAVRDHRIKPDKRVRKFDRPR